jgi:predicted outer membrane lipoprotein
MIYSKHLALYMASPWELHYDEARDREAAIPAFGVIAAMALSAFLDGMDNHPTCLVFLSLRLL